MADNTGLIVDALLRTNEDLYDLIDAGGTWAEAVEQRGARVDLYRRYERGDHRANMTEQMRKMLRLQTDEANLSEFNDNYCRIIIDKMSGRIKVMEINLGNETNNTWLNDRLEKNDFESAQGMWWRGAVREGDAYVLVDPISLLWSSEPAFDGFSGLVAVFNQLTKKPVWACKMWAESDVQDTEEGSSTKTVMHMVVYEPDRVSWWKGENCGNEVMPDDEYAARYGGGLDEIIRVVETETEEPSTSEVFGTKQNPDQLTVFAQVAGTEEEQTIPDASNGRLWPLGKIPIVHFADQQDNYTLYGESEIRPAIPLQDVLNRTLHSMVMASEFSAFPIKWAKGIAIDSTGITPGAVVNLLLRKADGSPVTELTAEAVQFLQSVDVGQFPNANLSQYTQQIDQIVRQISQCTQTPIYGVTSDNNLSGEALRQLEIGLVGKVKRFQSQNADAMKELIRLTAEIQTAFNVGGSAPALTTIAVAWASAELLDTKAQIEALMLLREKGTGLWSDDFYRSKIGAVLGMSQTDITKEGAKAVKEQDRNFDLLARRAEIIQPFGSVGQDQPGRTPPGGANEQ